jgi:hypothetical protein
MLSRHLLMAGGLLVAPALAQFTPLTTSNRAHLDAALCSDASHIAFRDGSHALGAVDTAGVSEVILHTSANNTLTSFVWNTNNIDLYFADGTSIGRVRLGGGAATMLATNVTGSDLRVVAVNAAANTLYGTRRNTSNNTTSMWRMTLPAGGQPVDFVTRPGRIDEVGIDSTGNWLLFRTWSGTQPVPATYERYDVVGAAALPMVTFNVAASSGHWVTSPNVFTVCTIAPGNPLPQIALADSIGQVEFLTDDPWPHSRIVAVDGAHGMYHETLSPTGGGTTIASVPSHGGSVMLSHGGQALVLNGGAAEGGLSFDGAETTLAFSAGTSASDPFPQIYLLDLHEDVHVHPHIHVNQTFGIEQHAHQGEIGVVAVADGITTSPIQVPPLDGDLWLVTTPGRINVVLTGVGSASGQITGSYFVPNMPQLVGVRLFVQGVSFDNTLAGEFSRLGYFQVF